MKRFVAAVLVVTPSRCPEVADPAPTAAYEAPAAAFPQGPSSRDRFDPDPPRQDPEVGRVFGGSAWGPSGPLPILRLDPTPGGGWNTFDGFGDGQHWEPDLGWAGAAIRVGGGGVGGYGGAAQPRPPRALLGADTPIEDVRCEGRRWSHGARTLCRTDGGLELFDGGAPAERWDTLPEVDADWSPDGQRLVWTDHRVLVLWDATGDGWTTDGDVWDPILTADGSLVVAVSRSSGFAIYDARDGARLDRPRSGAVEAAVLGPDGEVALATSDRVLRTWDADGRPLGSWTTEAVVRHLTWGGAGVCWWSGAAVCASPTGEELVRVEVPGGGFGFGPHAIERIDGALVVDGGNAVPADPVLVFDPSGEAVGLTRDGDALTLDLRTGALRPGLPEDRVDEAQRTGVRGGRTWTVRPDGGVLVR